MPNVLFVEKLVIFQSNVLIIQKDFILWVRKIRRNIHEMYIAYFKKQIDEFFKGEIRIVDN